MYNLISALINVIKSNLSFTKTLMLYCGSERPLIESGNQENVFLSGGHKSTVAMAANTNPRGKNINYNIILYLKNYTHFDCQTHLSKLN